MKETTMARPLPPMEESGKQRTDRFSASITLALWRVRQTWLLLVLAGVGLCAALLIACIVPLFTAVVTPTSLQAIFQAAPTRNDLTLSATTQGLSSQVISTLQHQLADPLPQTLGAYAPAMGPVTIQESYLSVRSPAALRQVAPLHLYATSLDHLEPFLQLVAGRWPASTTPGVIEVLLTPQSAQQLHLALGDTLSLQGQFATVNQASGSVDPATNLTVRLVGLFQVQPSAPLFLHGQTFQPTQSGASTIYTLLAPAPALLATLDQIATRAHTDAVFSYLGFQLSWDCLLHTTRVQPAQLDDLVHQLTLAQTNASNYRNSEQQALSGSLTFPYVTQADLSNPVPGSFEVRDLLQQYNSRTTQVSIPITILALQIIALLLFFVCLLMSMLLDRQVAASALLSSRGASNRQLFWSLFLQGLLICLCGAVLGPSAGTALVSSLVLHTLSAGSQQSVQEVLRQPLQVLATIAPTAGGTLFAALVTMGLIVHYTTRVNMLTLRRETARVSRQPFWQRYYLDVLAAVIALSGYGVSLYLASVAHEVDVTTQNLILAPLTLVAPLFLLLGFLLLFLRVFPWFLRVAGRVASRGRGATSMLALVQMARAPRQIIRMTLLLSLTVAFALFAQVFSASQTQRITTIAAYESGADFSGTLPPALSSQSMASIIARYRAIPGVTAASADLTDEGTTTGTGGAALAVTFRAIDVQSFAQTVIWGPADSRQPLHALLPLLSHAETATTADTGPRLLIPAIIDQALAQQLQLGVGGTFVVTLNDVPQSSLSYKVVAIVAHLPTVNASATASTSGPSGGMLVDNTVFAQTYRSAWLSVQQQQSAAQNQQGQSSQAGQAIPLLPINHLWLRTGDDARSQAAVRTALASSQLAVSNLYDRREIVAELQNDPFTLNILIILGIGGLAAFLLALIGDLLSSWVSVRTRLSGFVVLRALGATSRQIAGVLLWEQGMIYLGALVLGLAFGVVLSLVAVPVLVFTDLPAHGPMSTLSGTDFAFLQHALPVQIVAPLSLELIFAALVLVCLVALGIMMRTALHPSISGELRLNED